MAALPAARAVALAILGVLVGTASVLVHGDPTGLVLALVASAATTWALPGGWTLRFPFTTGWALLLAYALLPHPGGGYLIESGPRGYTVLGYGLVQMLLGIVTVRPFRPQPADHS